MLQKRLRILLSATFTYCHPPLKNFQYFLRWEFQKGPSNCIFHLHPGSRGLSFGDIQAMLWDKIQVVFLMVFQIFFWSSLVSSLLLVLSLRILADTISSSWALVCYISSSENREMMGTCPLCTKVIECACHKGKLNCVRKLHFSPFSTHL